MSYVIWELPIETTLRYHQTLIRLAKTPNTDNANCCYGCGTARTLIYNQFSSVTQLCPTLWDSIDCSMPGFLVYHQLPELLKLMSIKSVMPFNHLILCCPFLLLPSSFPSFRVFSNESVLIRLPKYWSFSFSISPSNEYSGLISFRIDLFDFLAVKGTLKSLQHHSSKASVLQHSTFLMVQL